MSISKCCSHSSKTQRPTRTAKEAESAALAILPRVVKEVDGEDLLLNEMSGKWVPLEEVLAQGTFCSAFPLLTNEILGEVC